MKNFFCYFYHLSIGVLIAASVSDSLFFFLIWGYLNSAAKVLANQPRPFAYDHRVKAIVPAGGGGLPSGHTQSTVVLWGSFGAPWLFVRLNLAEKE